MITLKHRSCSHVLDAIWEYDAARERVICVHRGDSFEIPVCLESNPERGAYVITRLSEDIWRISPAAFEFEFKAARWIARSAAYPGTSVAEFIALTGAPERVQKELEQL